MELKQTGASEEVDLERMTQLLKHWETPPVSEFCFRYLRPKHASMRLPES